ncbi:L,D-transpeptidase family protein [Methylobacterium planeticum]|uniref:Murein L,D-transpeptidase n=1 Tax=Methylobacterium planeticum TaxID=2615211 RepID=A0A6N6MNE1_9HYPH|nr:murein L,D-transpeptidase family protein [Methylobacterium planeticum]KAB1072803.1 murein L,D-transpeptidase [Methylobacterium planeticum]
MALRPLAVASLIAFALSLGACQDGTFGGGGSTRHLTPIPPKTLALMQTKGMSQGDPILIRAYKKEAEMEVWKRGASGQYALLKTFPICRWSGQLGPKTKQGDRQAPEGFYTITPGQMNPNSAYYLSFDTGYPNAFDRANGRTGNYIMVHGTCSSAGCFAMTDESMAEIYAVAREAFAGGQRAFQFQSYPFRMTAQNVAKFRNDPNAPFWKNLKEGSDYFEALREEPKVGQCGNRYVFGGADAAAGSCSPKVDTLVAEKREKDNQEIAALIAKGTAATRVVYDDGDQNPVFRGQTTGAIASLGSQSEQELAYAPKDYARHNLGDVSRPESLAAGPREVEVDAKGRPVMMAAAEAPIPTKAAAAALARKGTPKDEKKTAAPTLMAKQAEPIVEPNKSIEPSKPAAPARVTVADADGDPSAYQKVFGTLFGKAAPAPTPATPAVDAALPAQPEPTPVQAARNAHAAAHPARKAPAPVVKSAKVEAKAPEKRAADPAKN